jgi:hypothetical protein
MQGYRSDGDAADVLGDSVSARLADPDVFAMALRALCTKSSPLGCVCAPGPVALMPPRYEGHLRPGQRAHRAPESEQAGERGGRTVRLKVNRQESAAGERS